MYSVYMVLFLCVLGLCHSHSDVSLAKDPLKGNDNNEFIQEKDSTILWVHEHHNIFKAVNPDDNINFNVLNEEVSDFSHEVCMNGNISLSSVGSLQNLVNKSVFSEYKENLLESFKDGPPSLGSLSDQSISQNDSPLSSPSSLEATSFDSSDCDVDANLDFVWQPSCEIGDTCDIEAEMMDLTLRNIPGGGLYSKSDTVLKDGSDGKLDVLKKLNRKQPVPVEKLQYPTQATASIKENTGKKRGRKKIYNNASSLEEELNFKRARNNEACGKYRTMKKRKLEQLFEEEKSLIEDNSRLKTKCEQMEAEKKLLNNLILSFLRERLYNHSISSHDVNKPSNKAEVN